MDAQELRSLQEAYMEVVEGFRDLPVEKMKKKEDSLRSKNTSSGERVRSNIENVRTNIGKSQKTQSFGKSEISKRTSAKHHAAGFLRHAPWSPQDTPEKPDHKNKPNMYIRRSAGAKERHLKQREGRKRIQQESYDLYDIILSHLLDEGYAETPEAAEAIMVNMSEDWRESIVEEVFDEALTGERYKKAVKKPGGTAYSRMVSPDPAKRATRGGRGGESDFGAGDRGSGNKAARRAGTYKDKED
jgi:hypothetical protein